MAARADDFDWRATRYASRGSVGVGMAVRLLLWGMLVAVTGAADSEEVIADTSIGRIRGHQESVEGRDINVFTGIPYAKPPVGPLRFRRPVPVDPWEGILEADVQPNSCHQVVDSSFGRFPGVEMWNPNTKQSEDCLYLNLWAPADRTYGSLRAVIVWIYGGGFFSGTSTLPIYDGRVMASLGNVVVASLNYRNGPLGFLYLGGEEAPGNMGLIDQQLAIQWLYDHLETFGGDKTRITIMGESAGAASVSFHLLSPLSKDLINNAIMQSASAVSPWAYDSQTVAKSRAMDFIRKSGCPTEDDSEALECLRKQNASDITEHQWRVDDMSMVMTPLVPTVDDYFLTEPPEDSLKQGNMKNTNILIGAVHDEGTYFLYYGNMDIFQLNRTAPLTKEEYMICVESFMKKYRQVGIIIEAATFEYGVPYVYNPATRYRDVLDNLVGDYNFVCPVVKFADAYATMGQDVYMYRFLHRTSANPWPEWTGVMHGYEIDHVFGIPWLDKQVYTERERVLSRDVITYWTNFAKTGDPNTDDDGGKASHEWPVYNKEKKAYLNIDTPKMSEGQALRDRQCTFWQEFVPKLSTSAEKQAACGGSHPGLSLAALLVPALVLVLSQAV